MSEALPPLSPPELGRSVTESAEKIVRIREILFGAQMRDYTQKLDSTTQEVLRLQQEVKRLDTQLAEQDKTLRHQLSVENDRLRDQLQAQGKQQTQLLAEAEQRQHQQLQALALQHTQQIQQLLEQIQLNKRTVRDQVFQLLSRLNLIKAGRNMADE